MTLVSSVHTWRADAAHDFTLFCICIYLFPLNEEYGNMPWPIAINLLSSKFIAKWVALCCL